MRTQSHYACIHNSSYGTQATISMRLPWQYKPIEALDHPWASVVCGKRLVNPGNKLCAPTAPSLCGCQALPAAAFDTLKID